MLNRYARDKWREDFSIKGQVEWKCTHASVYEALSSTSSTASFQWDPGFYRSGQSFVNRETSHLANAAVTRILSQRAESINPDTVSLAIDSCFLPSGPFIETCGGGSRVAWKIFEPSIISRKHSELSPLLEEYIEKFVIPQDVRVGKISKRPKINYLSRKIEKFYEDDAEMRVFKDTMEGQLKEAEDFFHVAGALGWNSKSRAEILRRLTLASVGFMGAAIEWALIDASLLERDKFNYRSLALESLRLHSPAWRLGRTRAEEFNSSEGEEKEILLSVYSANRDYRKFETPNTFYPERWLNSRRIPKELLSFGAGDRTCPARSISIDLIEAVFEAADNAYVIYTKYPMKKDTVGTVSSPPRGLIKFKLYR